MVYFSIDIFFDTIKDDSFIFNPELNVYSTTLLGAVKQIRNIITIARSQISCVNVWYMGQSGEKEIKVLYSKLYDKRDFIAMINKSLGEKFL